MKWWTMPFGGIDTVILYETVPETDQVPEELVRIEYCGPEQQKELFFQGEKVYEADKGWNNDLSPESRRNLCRRKPISSS